MTSAAPEPSARPSYGRISAAGIALLAVLALLIWAEPRWTQRLQATWFDFYQTRFPRQIASTPATVVEIDEKSLARLGQWPWPRTVLAELLRGIERADPAAIGLDILMPEADRLSPERLLAAARQRDPVLDERLRWLPSSDIELARAIAAGRVVVGFAGIAEQTRSQPRVPPFVIIDRGRSDHATTAVLANVPPYAGTLGNVDEIDNAAAGHGAISAWPSEDVIRRFPLVIRVEDRVAPSLPLEMLRLALGEREILLFANGASVETIAVGKFVAPTEPDGAVRIYYSRTDPRRYVSAIDVLDGRIESERLARKLVIVGMGSGLATAVDYQDTPLGQRMPGSEILAQVFENLYDQTWLTRPPWARVLELAVFVLFGLGLVLATPRWKTSNAAVLAVGSTMLPIALGLAAFRGYRMVFDAAVPAIGLFTLFSASLLMAHAQAGLERRRLERVIRAQREQAAYIAGELEAAKRIQTGFLPRADALIQDPRVEIAASLVPAREVGGDLYDFFRLDSTRLFFMIGDVTGKGLSASMFMGVSKALYKSNVLRNWQAGAGFLMRAANDEVSRDNPEMFFVTAFAGVLDLDTGVIDYSNAGHDSPYVLSPAGDALSRLADAAGPPLCTVDGFAYADAERHLVGGDILCLVTDGVTDARNTGGERYGQDRLQALLSSFPREARTARDVVDAIGSDVRRFSTGAEPADDVTILAVRWIGPTATRSARAVEA